MIFSHFPFTLSGMNRFRWKIPRFRASFAGALCSGVFAGLLFFVMAGGWWILLPPAVAAAAFLLLERRFAALVAAGILLALGSAGVHALWNSRPGFYENQLPRRNCGGSAVLRVVDSRISALPQIAPPSLIRARMIEFKLSGEEQFRPASGIIYLRMPRTDPPPLRCGDVIRAEGAFLRPGSNALFLADAEGQLQPLRDFSSYLAGRGAARSFRALSCETLRNDPGFIGRIAACRDLLLARAVSSIKDERKCNLIAALFFGTSGGIDFSSRKTLIESGTIHLFSVSGMHVAMLAAILLWLLRPLPLRARYFTLAGLILLYVLSTGGNAPAMRAFFTIALWCGLRAKLYSIPPFQALLLAGCGLSLLFPRWMLDMGFQYSFIITGILILAGERFEAIASTLGEAFRFMPEGRWKYRRERASRFGWRFLFAAGTCLAAFLGGAGISLYLQGLLLPGSILANLLLLPVTGLLFPILFLKLAGGLLWSGFDRFGALLLEQSFQAMETITGLGATFLERLPAPHPALWEIWLFYFALFGLFLFRKKAAVLTSGAVLLLIAGSWPLRAELRPPALFVAHGGSSDIPVVALSDPGGAGVCVVNAAGYEGSGALADFLQRRGDVRIDRIVFTEARSPNLDALKVLAARLPVREAAFPDPGGNGRVFLRKLEETLPDTRILPAGSASDYGSWKILPQKNGFSLEYSRSGTTFQILLSLKRTDSGCDVTLDGPGGKREYLLPYGSVAEVLQYEFR